MFLEFDGYFINLAKINNIKASTEAWEADVWDLSIDMGSDDGETIGSSKGSTGWRTRKSSGVLSSAMHVPRGSARAKTWTRSTSRLSRGRRPSPGGGKSRPA